MLVKNHENQKACNVKKTLVKKGIVLLMPEMIGQCPIMIIDSGIEQIVSTRPGAKGLVNL